jgi:hypothetical protein
MTPEEQAAQDRIARIAKEQAALEARVKSMQSALTEMLVTGADTWLKSPQQLELAFAKFNTAELLPLVSQWGNDLLRGAQSNAEYFRAVALGEQFKDYAEVSAEAKQLVLDRFGLTAKGKLTKTGFFDGVLTDKTLLRKVVDQSWQLKSSGAGVDQYKKSIKALINGAPGGKGLVERHFDTFAYDTYQDNDAVIQDFYAKRLDLPAALYLGGEITGTRPFCHERNGKVFLRAEIEDMRTLKFAGKTSPYDPFINRGGYRCRHHWHWITAKQAARRDDTLYINDKGELQRGND